MLFVINDKWNEKLLKYETIKGMSGKNDRNQKQ